MKSRFNGVEGVAVYDAAQGPLMRTMQDEERQLFDELKAAGLATRDAHEWFVMGQLTKSDATLAVNALHQAVRSVRMEPPDLEYAQQLLDTVAVHCAEAPVHAAPNEYIPTLN